MGAMMSLLVPEHRSGANNWEIYWCLPRLSLLRYNDVTKLQISVTIRYCSKL